MTINSNLKLLTIIILLASIQGTVNSANRLKDYAQLRPLSWEQVSAKLMDEELLEEFNLADDCQPNLSLYENQIGEPRYSFIFLKNYYWSEFTIESGKVCIIKYTDYSRDINSAVVLTKAHSNQLLNAAKIFGFDETNKAIFNAHLNLQRQSVRSPDTLKYGGMLNVFKYMEENEPEKTYVKSTDFEISNDVYGTIYPSPIVMALEGSYSKDTLEKLKEQVRKEPPDKLSSGIYPFMTLDGLIAKAKEDVERGLKTYFDVFNDY